jgi:hypothetical protein
MLQVIKSMVSYTKRQIRKEWDGNGKLLYQWNFADGGEEIK